MKRKLCIALTIVPSILLAQLPDLVKTEGIKYPLHKKNTGRLFFTSTKRSLKELSEKDFLKSYTLTHKSNLFFIAFMNNSLTNYLHQIKPDLPADSLVKIGNYQFSLYIDGRLQYRSNLIPGAPYASILDTATMINRPLVDNENGTGSWSESFWNRFIANGGDSALTEGTHLLKLELRPYLQSDSIITGPLIASGELNVKVRREIKAGLSNIRLSKIAPYNGFPVSKDWFDQKKIKELKACIEAGIFRKISSVVVIKNGGILIEEYFNGANRYSLHDPRSVGKSFASTLTGIAIDHGYIRSEEQPLKDFYSLQAYNNFSEQKENVRIKNLLTMSTGFDGDDADSNSPGNEENMYPTADWVKFALDLPYQQSKEGRWHYFTAGTILLGDILNRKVNGGLEAFAHEKLFKPLHICNYKWQYTPQHVPNTAGGIKMNALDFAKYGQLYKNGGSWKGKQLISKEWVAKSFTQQVEIADRNNEYYGYLFWNKHFAANNKSYEAFYCAGNGGNYIIIFKEIPFVIVITATAYGQAYAHTQVSKMLAEYILPAIIK